MLSMYFWLFRNYLPLEKGRALHLNNLELFSSKDDLCQVWLELAQWFLRRKFLNFVNAFLLFGNYLSLEKALQRKIIEKCENKCMKFKNLLKNFTMFSQVSDVAHGPFVLLKVVLHSVLNGLNHKNDEKNIY